MVTNVTSLCLRRTTELHHTETMREIEEEIAVFVISSSEKMYIEVINRSESFFKLPELQLSRNTNLSKLTVNAQENYVSQVMMPEEVEQVSVERMDGSGFPYEMKTKKIHTKKPVPLSIRVASAGMATDGMSWCSFDFLDNGGMVLTDFPIPPSSFMEGLTDEMGKKNDPCDVSSLQNRLEPAVNPEVGFGTLPEQIENRSLERDLSFAEHPFERMSTSPASLPKGHLQKDSVHSIVVEQSKKRESAPSSVSMCRSRNHSGDLSEATAHLHIPDSIGPNIFTSPQTGSSRTIAEHHQSPPGTPGTAAPLDIAALFGIGEPDSKKRERDYQCSPNPSSRRQPGAWKGDPPQALLKSMESWPPGRGLPLASPEVASMVAKAMEHDETLDEDTEHVQDKHMSQGE